MKQDHELFQKAESSTPTMAQRQRNRVDRGSQDTDIMRLRLPGNYKKKLFSPNAVHKDSKLTDRTGNYVSSVSSAHWPLVEKVNRPSANHWIPLSSTSLARDYFVS